MRAARQAVTVLKALRDETSRSCVHTRSNARPDGIVDGECRRRPRRHDRAAPTLALCRVRCARGERPRRTATQAIQEPVESGRPWSCMATRSAAPSRTDRTIGSGPGGAVRPVSITIVSTTANPPAGSYYLGGDAEIVAPAQMSAAPLRLTSSLDGSLIHCAEIEQRAVCAA